MHKSLHQRDHFDGVTLSLNLQLNWDVLHLPPPSLHHPVWDPLRLQRRRRPKSGRRSWRGPVFFLQLMPLQLNSACNISSPVFISALQSLYYHTRGPEVRLSFVKKRFICRFLFVNFYKHALDTCLKFYLVVWEQPNSLGLRYVIPLKEESHLS